MGENSPARPAASAIVPPAEPSDSAISITKLTAPRSEGTPAYAACPAPGDWAQLATAPTLLLTPTEPADTDDAASTSRIATPPAMAVEEQQPWFKTGTTLPPPSMRPMAESVMPPPVLKAPNPRVFKVVAGVIAACLFIVAAAGMKLIYKHFRAPTATQTPSAESIARAMVATADLANPPRPAPETARSGELPSAAESAAPALASTAAARQADTARRAPVRSSPTRVTTKTTTRRAPAPKKTGRGTH